MQRPESTVTTPLAAGRLLDGGLRFGRVRGRTVVVAALAAVVAVAGTIVASAERDAWLRSHPAVPSLVGMTVADAARLMVPLHFGLTVNRSAQHPEAPMGVILVQNPTPGRRLAIGSIVQVTASQGSGVVPRLRGEPVALAARKLEAVGLRLGKVDSIEDSASPDTVLEQFTPPGRRVDPNSAVDVLVSGTPAKEPAVPIAPVSPAGSLRKLPPVPAAPATASSPRIAPPTAAPATAVRPSSTDMHEEGTPSAGAGSGDCAIHPERERDEVCHEPQGHGGAQPNVHGPEHHLVPPSP